MTSVDISIVSSAHDVADARLHRTAAALLRAGMTVEVIGLGDAPAAPRAPGSSRSATAAAPSEDCGATSRCRSRRPAGWS
ncbi:hypothetical protein ACU686_07245 [Yinghuangia aomiensis]